MAEIYDYKKDGEPEGGETKYEDYYVNLRSKVKEYIARHPNVWFAEYLLYFPDFFYLLFMLSRDEAVPRSNKIQMIAALAYFLSPIDIIPDIIPGMGWLDDLYIAMIVTSNLLNSVELSLVEKYWPGDENIVPVMTRTLDRLNNKFGKGAIERMLASLYKYTTAAENEEKNKKPPQDEDS